MEQYICLHLYVSLKKYIFLILQWCSYIRAADIYSTKMSIISFELNINISKINKTKNTLKMLYFAINY